MRRNSTMSVIATAAVLALMLLAAPSQPAAVGASTDSEASNSLVTYSAAPKVQLLADQPKSVQDLAHAAAEMVDYNDAEFLGSYVDQGGNLVIVANDKGIDRAREQFAGDGVTLERSDVTLAEASKLGERLWQLSPWLKMNVTMWGAALHTKGIFVKLNASPTETESRLIDEFANDSGVPIRVTVQPLIGGHAQATDDRMVDLSPYWGGARYAIATGSSSSAVLTAACSTGFGWEIGGGDYLITAGHCYPRNGSRDWMWIYSGSFTNNNVTKQQYAGVYYSSTVDITEKSVLMGGDNQYHGDLALVHVSGAGNVAGSRIWWGSNTTTSSIPVTAKNVPTVGDLICINGIISGSDCGNDINVVSETNVDVPYASGDLVRNVDIAVDSSGNHCSEDGDSGGSIIVNHPGAAETAAVAMGIISGNGFSLENDDCFTVFTGLEEATQAWDGDINYYND